jgi:hypothetical protein
VLHITNGDCAAAGLREAALPGTVVISADVLHEGPAPAVGETDWHRIRADHLASRGAGSADHIRSELAQWDANVDAASSSSFDSWIGSRTGRGGRASR